MTGQAHNALRAVAIALAAVVVVLVALIAVGTFDPKPIGRLTRTDFPGPRTADGLPLEDSTGPESWPAPQGSFSVRLSAAHAAGDTDSEYGLALSNGINRLVVAVSPLGYATVWEDGVGGTIQYMPWRPWPHVRPGGQTNELWLDVGRGDDRAEVTAWVNRERLWQGTSERDFTAVELWQGTFGEAATVDFNALEWFAEP